MSHQEHLFVYGTLRRGFNHPLANLLARRARFVGRGTFRGRLHDLGHYPGLIASTSPLEKVLGDVYALPQPGQLLSLLDEYEEYVPTRPAHSLYLRQEVAISMIAGDSLRAWAYLFNRPIAAFRRIPSGDYLSYVRARRR